MGPSMFGCETLTSLYPYTSVVSSLNHQSRHKSRDKGIIIATFVISSKKFSNLHINFETQLNIGSFNS